MIYMQNVLASVGEPTALPQYTFLSFEQSELDGN